MASRSRTPEGILQLGLGFWGSKTLLSAVELGLFTELARKSLDAVALTKRLGLHPRSARDCLRRIGCPWHAHTSGHTVCQHATLAGARVVGTAEAEAIWRAGTGVFIDVLPRAPKPPNLPAGTLWRDKPRLNIPGSIWLPDTGYGKLAEATEAYLQRGLERASGGNKAALLVIYCQENCWMSWNAAKRVLSYGYPNVAWYPDGTEGWERANLPVAESQPESEQMRKGADNGPGRKIAKTTPCRRIAWL